MLDMRTASLVQPHFQAQIDDSLLPKIRELLYKMGPCDHIAYQNTIKKNKSEYLPHWTEERKQHCKEEEDTQHCNDGSPN